MKMHPVSILFLCLFATSCAEVEAPLKPRVPASTYAGVIENVRNVPIEGVFFNECCGEDVHISGTAHFLITNNVIHVVVQDLTGTGLSSDLSYIGRGASVETNVSYSSPDQGTFTFALNMANENGCGFRVKVTNHLTTNANGDIATVVEKFETQCH